MKVEILHIPECPNTELLVARLKEALTDRSDVVIRHQVIYDGRDAAQHGMAGSPTILIDGVDPFTASNQAPSLSCRLYIEEHGTTSGVPSLEQLRAALKPKP